MIDSIEIVKSYIIPAYQYAYGEIGGMISDTLDKHVRDLVIYHAGDSSQITLRDIKRSIRRKIDKLVNPDQQIKDVMDTLAGYGWVAEIESTKVHTLYAINPAIGEQFADYRRSVIIARQRSADRRRNLVIKHGSYTDRKIVRGYDPATMDE